VRLAYVEDDVARTRKRDRTPWWLPHVEFLVVMGVLAFARPDPVVAVALAFVALAVIGWQGPWPPLLGGGKDPPDRTLTVDLQSSGEEPGLGMRPTRKGRHASQARDGTGYATAERRRPRPR